VETVDAARCDAPSSVEPVSPVQQKHPELLVIERGQPRTCPCHDGIAVRQTGHSLERGREHCPPTQFDGGREAYCLCRADTLTLSELTYPCARESGETSVPFNEYCCQLGNWRSSTTSKDEGYKLGVTYGIDASHDGALL
jgi:hypothetical protein